MRIYTIHFKRFLFWQRKPIQHEANSMSSDCDTYSLYGKERELIARFSRVAYVTSESINKETV